MKFLFLLLSVICISSTCTKSRVSTAFFIKNNSSKTVNYAWSDKYPDTSLTKILYQIPIDPLQTKGPFYYSVSPGSGIVEIFLFDSITVVSNPWDSITEKYMILKRYDLTIDSIDKMNRIVTYP
ncbi:MAG TPA: hypothetical protein VMU83_02250 [Hanamia sp.]|nr:hypothetical protein [Hanamia sp.]